jgi:tetratricopeptide (TPR) repeat protein
MLLVGLLGASLLAANPPTSGTNAVSKPDEPKPAVSAGDTEEREFQNLMDIDDTAREDIDRWMDEDQQADALTRASQPPLSTRIRQRMEMVRKLYGGFLREHPHHVKALTAYGSFLMDMGEEDSAAQQWVKARKLDPTDPAVWNNLGNYYSHNGEPRQAFECYDKAISLRGSESLYYHNLATAIYLHRKAAAAYYDLTEIQLRNRTMALYRKALALDATNFLLATDVAQTYYGFKPPKTEARAGGADPDDDFYNEALEAWSTALRLAPSDEERQGVQVHLARVNIMAGRLKEARRHLDLITNSSLATVKGRLEGNLVRQEGGGLTAPPPTLRPVVPTP